MVRNAHFWTADKLDFLEEYIPAFVRATKKAPERYYVDGFSGPGRNSINGIERDGSPLIALNSSEPCNRYFFVERRRALYEQLENHVKGHSRAGLVSLNRGDFNGLVGEILQEIPDRAPCPFFLDPEGLELEFATVEKISRRTKIDLFILISGSGLIRNIHKGEATNKLTKFFGDDSWKNLYEQYWSRKLKPGAKSFETFTDLYISKLKTLGFNVCDRFLIARNRNNVALHSLVFAIKSNKPEAALKIAPSILDKVRLKNQPSLF